MGTCFRDRLLAKEVLCGTLAGLSSPDSAEVLARCGFDWLFIDAEHSAMDFAALNAILATAGRLCPCVVRVPGHSPEWIKKVLDLGPAGVIIPLVNDPETAARLVSACRYPPEGARSVGIGRAHGFGLDFAGYLARANRETAVILQAEHILAVENIEKILDVSSPDAIFVGPYDLSASMDKIGQVNDPDVLAAIETVARATRARNIALGIFGVIPEAVIPWRDKGFTLLCAGCDTLLLAQAAQAALGKMKG
ncbi:MAG: aldolase/citrate lyase family protein [Thermodesulfobacteriota bacterium]